MTLANNSYLDRSIKDKTIPHWGLFRALSKMYDNFLQKFSTADNR